jgi:hypothetical protein
MRSRIFGLLAAIIAAATLGACGGGGGDSVASRIESPFASAAMFVPTGAASKSFPVSSCVRISDPAPVTSATLLISANGDMAFSGAIGTGTVSELARINFADTNNRAAYGDIDAGDTGFQVDYQTADNRIMSIGSYGTGSFYSNSPTAAYECNAGPTTMTFALEQPLSQARVVNNIVTGSTGTVALQPDSSVGSYTQTGSIVSWDSGRTGTFARFISFNLDTAQFGQGNSLNPSTHTPVAFALPALGSSIYGNYEEYLDSFGNKTIYFTYDNINVYYRRYADPAANAGNARQFRMYSTGDV